MSKYSYLNSTPQWLWCFWANGSGFCEGAGEPPQYSVQGQLLTPSPISMPVSGHSEGQCSICDGIHGPSSLNGGMCSNYLHPLCFTVTYHSIIHCCIIIIHGHHSFTYLFITLFLIPMRIFYSLTFFVHKFIIPTLSCVICL